MHHGYVEATLTQPTYDLGDCFRCIRTNVQVTHIGEIHSPDHLTPLFACRWCVQALIVMHHRAHEPLGRGYVALPQP